MRQWASSRLDRWELSHTRTRVATSCGETHLVQAGSGPDDVVLVPGTNFCAAAMLPLVGTLAPEFRVTAVDLPGQPGLSAGTRLHNSQTFRPWLAEVIAAAGVDRPVVIGHSLGGLVAMEGASAGAPVRGLLLLDPAGLVRLRVTPALVLRTLPWLLRPTTASAARLLRAMAGPDWTPSPELSAWMALVGGRVRSSLAPKPMSNEALRRLAVPVRVVGGEHDVFLPPRALTKGAARVPGATYRAVAGAGHLLPDENPGAVLDSLREFLRALEGH